MAVSSKLEQSKPYNNYLPNAEKLQWVRMGKDFGGVLGSWEQPAKPLIMVGVFF